MKAKTAFLLIIILIGIILLLIAWQLSRQSSGIVSPLGLGSLKQIAKPTPKPLIKYTFENLKKRKSQSSQIKLERVLKEEEEFIAYLFSYTSDQRKITGLAHLPEKPGQLPVIVMLRGYVDQEIYETGIGTSRAGEVFSRQGFITLAPDFLGYGESDMPPNNVWEERFLRLTSVIDLLASIKNLIQADPSKIFLWGHSNGGMIALSVLEITEEEYPATLWAPVSQFFPYDILYYTYEFDDKGKALRKNLAEFEKDYQVNQYSFDEYLDWLKAPLQLHQGTGDEYIPLSWSDNLVKELKEREKEVNYYLYPGADHNMKGAWDLVVQRDIEFFRKKLQ